jgi:hypothetical protein
MTKIEIKRRRDFDYRDMQERTMQIVIAVAFLGLVALYCATVPG